MRQIIYILVILTLISTSCNKIKNKGKEIKAKAENKIKSKSKDLIDKAFPHFDSKRSDTKYNKLRFVEYLEVELSSDVSNIYCFGDFLGVDYKVLFSFKCDPSTITRIVKKKGLSRSNLDHGLLFSDHFNWWNKEKINSIKPYKKGKESEF